MITIDYDKCCGCRACAEICPRNAISMLENENGFVFPKINNDLCVDCGACEKVCPLNYDDFIRCDGIKSFVGTSKSDDAKVKSTSGGAFTAIYETYIAKGYTVFGVTFDSDFKVIHDEASTIEECGKFRKSKYVQSDTNGCFGKIAERLSSGGKVLFAGVACQVAALKSFLKFKNISDENLVTVNILCKGVPNQTLFDSYLREMEKEEKSKVVGYEFRSKGGNVGELRNSKISFENGNVYYKTKSNDAFWRGFGNCLFLRKSCETCHFVRKEKVADFTLADAWNADKINPKINPNDGVSLILLNTEKARAAEHSLDEKMNLEEVPTEWALTSQRALYKYAKFNKNRDKFFDLWHKVGFRRAVFRCTRRTLKQTVYAVIKKLLGKNISRKR